MELCLAYVPKRAELFTLDALGWFLLRACEGTTVAGMVDAYHAAMSPQLTRAQAQRQVKSGLERLESYGIVEVQEGARIAGKPTRRSEHHAEAD